MWIACFSWCCCHHKTALSYCVIKIQTGFMLLAPSYPGFVGEKDVKGFFVFFVMWYILFHWFVMYIWFVVFYFSFSGSFSSIHCWCISDCCFLFSFSSSTAILRSWLGQMCSKWPILYHYRNLNSVVFLFGRGLSGGGRTFSERS